MIFYNKNPCTINKLRIIDCLFWITRHHEGWHWTWIYAVKPSFPVCFINRWAGESTNIYIRYQTTCSGQFGLEQDRIEPVLSPEEIEFRRLSAKSRSQHVPYLTKGPVVGMSTDAEHRRKYLLSWIQSSTSKFRGLWMYYNASRLRRTYSQPRSTIPRIYISTCSLNW